MTLGAFHCREAERLLDQAHHYTYGDGADPVTGSALAAEAQAHAPLAPAAAVAIPPEEPNTGDWVAWEEATKP